MGRERCDSVSLAGAIAAIVIAHLKDMPGNAAMVFLWLVQRPQTGQMEKKGGMLR